MENKRDHYVYMIRCKDESLYTGITTDVERRYREHEVGRGAKYTKAKGVKNLEIYFQCQSRGEASKIEIYMKSLTKQKKEFFLINQELLAVELREKIGVEIKIK